MSVTLALRKRKGGPWAWLIRRWTRSDFDHCELVVDGAWYSSLLWSGGVRATHEQPPGEWVFVDLPWADAVYAQGFYLRTSDEPYDILGIIGAQIIAARAHVGNAWTCSEWCAAALGLPTPEMHNPGTLARLCERINEITKE